MKRINLLAGALPPSPYSKAWTQAKDWLNEFPEIRPLAVAIAAMFLLIAVEWFTLQTFRWSVRKQQTEVNTIHTLAGRFKTEEQEISKQRAALQVKEADLQKKIESIRSSR